MNFDITSPVSPRLLADQISAAIGQDAAVNCRQPGQLDRDGNELPGVLTVVDNSTGEPLPEDDAIRAQIAAVIAAHVVPDPPKPVMEQLAEAVSGASNFADLQAAVIAFAQANTPPPSEQPDRPVRRARN